MVSSQVPLMRQWERSRGEAGNLVVMGGANQWNVRWRYQYSRFQWLIICISSVSRDSESSGWKTVLTAPEVWAGVMRRYSCVITHRLTLWGDRVVRWHPSWHQAYWTSTLSLKFLFSHSGPCVREEGRPTVKRTDWRYFLLVFVELLVLNAVK